MYGYNKRNMIFTGCDGSRAHFSGSFPLCDIGFLVEIVAEMEARVTLLSKDRGKCKTLTFEKKTGRLLLAKD